MQVTIELRRQTGQEQALLFKDQSNYLKLRPSPVAAFASVCLHVCVLSFLTLNSTVPRSYFTRYQVKTINLHSQTVTWYLPKDHLPNVASNRLSRAGIPKVRFKHVRQRIAADALRPQPGKQLIWQAPPKISLSPEAPSPNLLAFIARPARPESHKTFIPPDLRTPAIRPPILPEAAPLAVPLTAPLPLATITGPIKLPLREFVPPPATSGIVPPTTVLEIAPNLTPQEQTPQPLLAIVGLDPERNNNIPLPEGVRTPRFSAGPDNEAEGRPLAAIVIPGLNVRGNGVVPSAVIVPRQRNPPAYHEPSPQEWVNNTSGKDSRRLARSMMSAALRPSARVIAPSVEAHFPNRSVYTTSFELGRDGSMEWVIWFAEQGLAEDRYVTIRPPLPWSRGGGGPEAKLPPGRFEVAAVIEKDGQLSSVTVLTRGDEAGREAASKFIADWAFLPALRNGEPITVDALIEVRFRPRP
jgi:Gram-negative bacterial TonB protein C-terminal